MFTIPATRIVAGRMKLSTIPVAGTGITVHSILPGPTRSRGVNEFVGALAKKDGMSFAEFEKELVAFLLLATRLF
jgi:hypothetical protein